MDETLNRPLFKNKARHYEQIKTNNVGKHYTGVFAQIPRLYQAGKAGVQAFRAAQAARPAVGKFKQAGERLGEIVAPLDKPIVNVGIGGLGVTEGYQSISQGIEDRDVGQVISGIGQGVGGARFGIRGLTQAGYPRAVSLSETLQKSKLGQYTDPVTLKGIPFYGSAIAAGFIPNEKNDVKRELDARVKQYESTTGQKATPEQINRAQIVIAEEFGLQKPQQPKTALDLAFPGLSNVDIIEGKGRQDPVNLFSDVSRNIVQQSNDAKGIPPTGLSKEEYVATLDNDERKRKSGEDIIKKASTDAKLGDSAASRFQKFYEQYDKEIGGSREISDLIMYKLATGLLTGTTTKSGFAGFADVLGKAGGDVLDTAILLASKEKDRKASLFEAFMKSEKANESNAITAERYTTIIPDPNAFNGVRVEERAKFKNGLDAKAVASNEIDPVTGINLPVWIQAEYNPNAIETKKDPKLLDERRAALNSVASSYRMADAIAKADPGTIGAPGSIKLFKEKIIGSVAGILENEITPPKYNKDIDLFVNNEILGQGVRKADGTFISAKDAIAEKEKMINDIVEKKTKSKFFQRPSKNELEKLVRNTRYETNFAYAYANSLKAEDRLTEKNLEDAKRVSKIFGLESPDKIIEQFKQLADDANTKFGEETKRYQALGGNSAFFDQNFTFMPYYQKEKNRIGGQQRRQEIQQNLMKGVETLPDKYK
jgi:hypothetical protein